MLGVSDPNPLQLGTGLVVIEFMVSVMRAIKGAELRPAAKDKQDPDGSDG